MSERVIMLNRSDLSFWGGLTVESVDQFCGNCDLYVKETDMLGDLGKVGCKLNQKDDLVQARYVGRKWCGWASVNGQRGQMTKNGFES